MNIKKSLALRLACLVIISVMAWQLAAAAPLTTAEKEQMYTAAILDLETYLEGGSSASSLAGVEAVFSQLGGYEYSRPLMYYTQVLSKIDKNEFDFDLDLLLDMLESNTAFSAYLQDSLKSSAIEGVGILKAYTAARELEANGRNAEALAQYKQCMSFFDSDSRYYHLTVSASQNEYDRAQALLRSGDYAGGYFAFSRASGFSDSADRMKAIVNQLGYTPQNEKDNPQKVSNVNTVSQPDSVSLSWNKPKHASRYRVSMRIKGEEGWNYYDWHDEYVIWNNLSPRTEYEFSVITIAGKIELEPVIITVMTPERVTPTPTITPSPTPTKTPEPIHPEILSARWVAEDNAVVVRFRRNGLKGNYSVYSYLKSNQGKYTNGRGNPVEKADSEVIEYTFKSTGDFIPGETYGFKIRIFDSNRIKINESAFVDVTVPISYQSSPIQIAECAVTDISASALQNMKQNIKAAWAKDNYSTYKSIAENTIHSRFSASERVRISVTSPGGARVTLNTGGVYDNSLSAALGFSFADGFAIEPGTYTMDFYDWDRKCYIGTWYFKVIP